MTRAVPFVAALLLVAATHAGCSGGGDDGVAPPNPALDAMERRVAERMNEAREEVVRRPSAENWGRLGAVYAAHGLHEEAEVCHARAAELDPEEFRWAYFLAIDRAFNGAAEDEVVELFRAASKLRQDYVPLYVRWGRALVKRGRHEAAIDAFGRALEMQPGLAHAALGLGQAWLGLGNADRALPYLERFGGSTDADAAGALALSQAYRMLGREAESARAAEVARRNVSSGALPDPVWEESVEAEGISSSACYQRARRKLRQGRHAEAIEDLLVVEEVRPGRAGVQSMFGSAYRALGRAETAIEHFSRAVELRDDQAWVRRELGELYEETGRLQPALEQYRAAVELGPDSPAHYVAVVRVQSRLNDLPGAMATLRLGIDRLPQAPGLRLLMGLALRDAGRPVEALAEFQTLLGLEPPSARTHYQIGLTLERMGRRNEALIYYREAVAIDPAHVAREQIDRLTRSR